MLQEVPLWHATVNSVILTALWSQKLFHCIALKVDMGNVDGKVSLSYFICERVVNKNLSLYVPIKMDLLMANKTEIVAVTNFSKLNI